MASWDMLLWLGPKEKDHNGELAFDLEAIKAKHEVRKLTEDGWLALSWHEPIWLQWAVLRFVMSDADGKNAKVQVIVHGEGPASSLRECRHSWWGDNGYFFDLRGDILTAAFSELSEFYDNMVKE